MQTLTRKRSLWGRLRRAYRAFLEPLQSDVLPLNNGGKKIQKDEVCRVHGRPQVVDFHPERFFVSNTGTPGGAADWIVCDVQIAGRSQFIQAGDVPGDMFATSAIESFMQLEVARDGVDVAVIVRYVGPNPEGCAFYGSMSGMEHDPSLVQTIREGFSVRGLVRETLTAISSAV